MVGGGALTTTGSRLTTTGSRLPTTGSRMPTTGSRLTTTGSRLPPLLDPGCPHYRIQALRYWIQAVYTAAPGYMGIHGDTW